MPVNEIVQMKTVPVNGPDGPTVAMMIGVNLDDLATADAFVPEVAEQFKLNRMTAPPETNMLLITLVGDLDLRFAEVWAEVEQRDPVVKALLSLMIVADVVQGTRKGEVISRASLKGE